MKTPITDKAFADAAKLNPNSALMKLGIVSRKLESDRTELMKALDWLDRWLGDKPMTECSKRITDVLAAARTNFPKS